MTTYTLFGQAAPPSPVLSGTTAWRAWGTDFDIAQQMYLTGIWVYSMTGATVLPAEIGIYYDADSGLIAGTHVTSITWSGAAGSGWVKASFSHILLDATGSAGRHRVTAGGPGQWLATTAAYWSTGPGSGGITNGPLSVPVNTAGNSYTVSSGPPLSYPTTRSVLNPWVDVEVDDSSGGTSSGLLMAAGIL